MRTSLQNGQELVIELPGGYQLVAFVSEMGLVAVAAFQRGDEELPMAVLNVLPPAQGA